MKNTLQELETLLQPLGYQKDLTQDTPIFWKRVQQKDVYSPYAFSLVLVTLDRFTICIEGLNEPRIKYAVNAGLIKLQSPEDVEELKEIVLETTLDNLERLRTVLPFFEQQLMVIETETTESDKYKKALENIELLVDAANEVEY